MVFVSWKYKKQDCVFKSSTEAKYHAMFIAYSKIIWLCGLLIKLGFFWVHPIPLYTDNTNTIEIIVNPVYYECTKTTTLFGRPLTIKLLLFHTSSSFYILQISSPNPWHISAIIFLLANWCLKTYQHQFEGDVKGKFFSISQTFKTSRLYIL